MADVLCAGDGEFTVFEALKENSPKLIDGDDNRSPYFLTNEFYNASPYPALHLVDIESYKYNIEGFRARVSSPSWGALLAAGSAGAETAKV